MYTYEKGKKIPLRNLQDLAKVNRDRISVYDESGIRILKEAKKHVIEEKLNGESMGIFSKVKKAVGKKIDDRSREKTLQKKVEYNELKKTERVKAETLRKKGLTEDEARFLAEREVKREADAKKKAETSARIKKATDAFAEMGREMNRSPGPAPKKVISKKTKRAAKNEETPNPNKLGFKI